MKNQEKEIENLNMGRKKKDKENKKSKENKESKKKTRKSSN